MRKSFFFRIFIIFLAVSILSLAILGIMVSDIFNTSFMQQKLDSMLTGVTSVISLSEQYYYNRISNASFIYQLKEKRTELNSDIYIVDTENSIIGTTYESFEPSISKTIPEDTFDSMLRQAIAGNTTQYVSATKIIDEPTITVATPLRFTSNKEIMGVIFITSDLTSLYKIMQEIYIKIILAALLTTTIIFALTYLLSGVFIRDLQEISDVARKISAGNYSARARININTEIGDLARTFNKMAEDIERLEGLRTTFVSNVSHELRTPITSIHGFISGILDGTIPKSDERSYLNTVLLETKRLSKLITDLLELSKVESGKFPLYITSFDINELLCQCFFNFENQINSKHIDVSINIGSGRLIVRADIDRITQVLTNLIDNAIKFSPINGKMSASISVNNEDNTAVICISDSGFGIPNEDVPYVFERFYKTDRSHTRKNEGYGIGLSIVSKIIEQHRQKIWIESSLGEGTKFLFTLDLDLQQ